MLALIACTAVVLIEAARTERLVGELLDVLEEHGEPAHKGSAEARQNLINDGNDASHIDSPSSLSEEFQHDSGMPWSKKKTPPPHDNPEVVKKALSIAWAKTQERCQSGDKTYPSPRVAEHKNIDFEYGSGWMGTYQCKVDILPSVNYLPGRLCVVREAWSQQFPDGFMADRDVEQQAQSLINQFTKLAKITEGSKSGSSIYVSDTKQLFLKSETETERKVFIKKHKTTKNYFVEDYAARVTGNDNRRYMMKSPNLAKAVGKNNDRRKCERSTLQHFLLVFTVACKGWTQWYDPTVWTLFAHISPLPQVPKPLHQFDLKASRDEGDCHHDDKKGTFTGTVGAKEQGYLGDFMGLYKTPIASAQCDAMRLDFVDSDTSNRRTCLMKAIHMDLKLLASYNLVDYSYLVTTHKYNAEEDDQYLQEYNNLLKVRVEDTELVLTIGLIDLLRDLDVDTGLQFQSNIGINKDLSISHHVYEQAKFEDYSYYLFCLAAEHLDPKCHTTSSRSLELLSKSDAEAIKESGYSRRDEVMKRCMDKYHRTDTFCEHLASCQVLNDREAIQDNINKCQDAACKAFGLDTCPAEADGQWSDETQQKVNEMWRRLGLWTS